MASPATGASLPVPSHSLLRFLRLTALPGTGRRPCPATYRGFGSPPTGSRKKFSTSSPAPSIPSPAPTASTRSPACVCLRPSASTPWLARQTPSARKQFSISSNAAKAKASDLTSDSEKSWQERLWGSTAKKGGKPLQPDDLPGHHEPCDDGASMFNNRRTLAAKAALEPRLRCTEVDENGEVILVDGEFKKTELIAKVREKAYVCTILLFGFCI
jgi:magnesium transporter